VVVSSPIDKIYIGERQNTTDWMQLQPHLPKEIGKLCIPAPEPGTFHCNTHNPLLK
jgi:hypothetical protein